MGTGAIAVSSPCPQPTATAEATDTSPSPPNDTPSEPSPTVTPSLAPVASATPSAEPSTPLPPKPTIAPTAPPSASPTAIATAEPSPIAGAYMTVSSISQHVGYTSHFNYRNTQYVTRPSILAMAKASPFKMWRDSSGNSPGGSIATNPGEALAQIHDSAPVPAKYIEPCGNEWDHHNDASRANTEDWAGELVACYKAQVPYLKKTFPGKPLVGFSLANAEGDTSKLVAAFQAAGIPTPIDVHPSFHWSECGNNPEIDSGASSFASIVAAVRKLGNDPWLTESGYDTYDPKLITTSKPADSPYGRPCAIPNSVITPYYLRQVLYLRNLGVTEIMFYQFADVVSDTVFGGCGAIDKDGNPKPQYTALLNLVKLYTDATKPVTPMPHPAIQFAESANVMHNVAQRNDGSLLVAEWRAARDFDWQSQKPIAVPLAKATVTVPGYHAVAIHAFEADGSVQTLPAASSVTNLGSSIQVLEFAPNAVVSK